MKTFLYGALAALMLTSAASAASVTILSGKTNGTRIETTVTPGPELPDTVIPGTPAIPGKAATKGKSHPTDVRNGDCPQVPAMNGVMHTPVGLNADCVYAWSLSEPVGSAAIMPVAATPDTVIDGGYGPDIVTETPVPTCTRKYKTISTSRPYLSYSESTSDGAC